MVEALCLLDPRKICLEFCRLHNESINLFRALADIQHVTLEELITNAPKNGGQYIQFRTNMAGDLRDRDLIEKCNNYPDSEIKIGEG